jgi:hypothetical protein
VLNSDASKQITNDTSTSWTTQPTPVNFLKQVVQVNAGFNINQVSVDMATPV